MSTVTARSWQEEAFETAVALERRGESGPSDDLRSLDWRYLLPWTGNERVLVVGCGTGQTACSLAGDARSVHVIDTDPARLAALQRRLDDGAIGNVSFTTVAAAGRLPFPDASFDVIAAGSGLSDRDAGEFAGQAREARRLLAPGGVAQFTVVNRWSPLALIAGQQAGPAASLSSCRRALRASGFEAVRVYAPLPLSNRPPLVLLPLDTAGPGEFFLRHLTGIFDTASPEMKQRFGWWFTAGRAGLHAAARLRGAHLLRYIVPGYCLLALAPKAAD
jgi:SAM-dependent methyltransferase